jgi:putative YphP/YqiW family bacilliredoxin
MLFTCIKYNTHKTMYPIALTTPMSQDLTDFGFESLTTPEAVEQAFENQEGTTLLVVNSVCGCAAAMARPGAKHSVTGEKRPDRLFTVFAGVDKEATDKARQYLLPYPPSSPSIALFKDGKLVHFLERRHIEGRSADVIADNLMSAYNTYC